MPTETQLSQETAFAAITEILGVGEFPSVTRVRQRLGGKGSNPVLQRFLDAWFRANGAAAAGQARAAVPTLDPSQVRAQIEAVTSKALQDFEAAQAARIAELDDRQARLDAGERDLLDRTNRQAALEAAHEELLAVLRGEVAAAIEAVELERQRADAALSDARAAREQRDTLSEETARLRKAAQTLATTQAELTAARENQQQLRAQVVELTAQLSRQHGQIEAAQATATHERARVERLEAELAAARVSLGEALQAAQTSAGRLAAAEQALSQVAAGQQERERRLEALAATAHTGAGEQAAALRELLGRGEAQAREVLEALGRLPEQVAAVVIPKEPLAPEPPRRPSGAKRRGS